MNRPFKPLLLVVLIIALFNCDLLFAQSNDSPIDSSAISKVIYEDADIVIDYGWGEPERISKVTATVILVHKKAIKVEIDITGTGKYTVSMVQGVTVRIYDHRSGKLLRTCRSVNYT